MTKAKPNNQTTIINSLIGVAIMLFFRYLPISLPGVTPIGMQILGIFIGTLYLWTTVDILWSSLLSIAMIAMSDYGPMGQVLASAFGNPTVVQMFFMMIVMGALVHEKITLYIGRFFLTRKFTEGKPWLFTYVILIGSYIMSVFVGCFAPIFLFWPVMYGIFDQVGFKKTDKYPRIMVIMIVMAAMIGFPVPPYMSNGLALLSNYRTIAANAGAQVMINDGKYFIFCFVMGALLLTVLVLFIKYVLRPDVTPLKSLKLSDLEKNPLPAMSKRQKIVGGTFVVYVLCMLVPTLAPNLPGMKFLSQNSLGLALTCTAILAAIPMSDGKPCISVPSVIATDFAWPTFFICTAAILIGSVLTNESTGITVFLNTILSPIFSNMNTTMFTIVLLLITVVLTNLCNSLVIGMIMQPVILMYCTNTGINAAPIVTLLIFTVLLSASVTPAASPFAAMMFGNKDWLKSSDVFQYAGALLVVEIIVILVIGIPFANFML